MSNPIYGDIGSNTRDKQRKDKPQRTNNSRASFATSTSTSTPESEKPKLPKKWCYSCKSDTHSTEDCRILLKKPYDERLNDIKKMGLCFACLRKGKHISKDCKEVDWNVVISAKTVESRLEKRVDANTVCGSCKAKHPTVLHRERKQHENNVSTQVWCARAAR